MYTGSGFARSFYFLQSILSLELHTYICSTFLSCVIYKHLSWIHQFNWSAMNCNIQIPVILCQSWENKVCISIWVHVLNSMWELFSITQGNYLCTKYSVFFNSHIHSYVNGQDMLKLFNIFVLRTSFCMYHYTFICIIISISLLYGNALNNDIHMYIGTFLIAISNKLFVLNFEIPLKTLFH